MVPIGKIKIRSYLPASLQLTIATWSSKMRPHLMEHMLARRWNRATRMIVLRLRAKKRMFFGSSAGLGALRASVKAVSFLSSGVLGPQLSLVFNLAPPQLPARSHAPRPLTEPADLQIEVRPASHLNWPSFDNIMMSVITVTVSTLSLQSVCIPVHILFLNKGTSRGTWRLPDRGLPKRPNNLIFKIGIQGR